MFEVVSSSCYFQSATLAPLRHWLLALLRCAFIEEVMLIVKIRYFQRFFAFALGERGSAKRVSLVSKRFCLLVGRARSTLLGLPFFQ